MDEIYSKIAGVSFNNTDGSQRQNHLSILENQRIPLPLILKPEPENPYDPYAIAVLSPSGEQLGYLRRSLSYSISQMLEYSYHISVELIEITGLHEASHNYGANIRIRFEEPCFDLDSL